MLRADVLIIVVLISENQLITILILLGTKKLVS